MFGIFDLFLYQNFNNLNTRNASPLIKIQIKSTQTDDTEVTKAVHHECIDEGTQTMFINDEYPQTIEIEEYTKQKKAKRKKYFSWFTRKR